MGDLTASSPLVIVGDGSPLVSFSLLGDGDFSRGEERGGLIFGCGLVKRICPTKLVMTGTLMGLGALVGDGLDGRMTRVILTDLTILKEKEKNRVKIVI